jgi:iron-sulfur cluster assembly protein
MSIQLTPKAAGRIKEHFARHDLNPSKAYLHVGIRGGGCSGFSYHLEVTDELPDQATVADTQGVQVYCTSENQPQLEGLTIDYQDSDVRGGFVFDNPNATRRCGCGASFAL